MLSQVELNDLHQQWNEYWREEVMLERRQNRNKQEKMYMNSLTCIRLLFKNTRINKLKLRWRKGKGLLKTKMAVGGVRERERGRPKKELFV
jgi:hypothetical protein